MYEARHPPESLAAGVQRVRRLEHVRQHVLLPRFIRNLGGAVKLIGFPCLHGSGFRVENCILHLQ